MQQENEVKKSVNKNTADNVQSPKHSKNESFELPKEPKTPKAPKAPKATKK